MPRLRFRGVQGYLLTEHPTPGGSIIQILAIERSDCSVRDNCYLATSSENSGAALNAARNTANANSEACALNALACCTPAASSDDPRRLDSPFPRDMDMATGNAAGAARRETRAPRRNRDPFRSRPRKKNNRGSIRFAVRGDAADQNQA